MEELKAVVATALTAVLMSGCKGAQIEGVGGSAGEGQVEEPACVVNADCEGSAAADKASEAKCPVAEYFCSDGRCEAACARTCDPVNGAAACDQGVCTPYIPSLWYCHMRSIACETLSDCPTEAPAGSNGSADRWSCQEGVCEYPGVTYPTD